MSDEFQKRVEEAMRNPKHMGELPGADAIGTVGNADCGDMLRVWVKYKEENGRKVIDEASFQSFGCETAIAAASLAMELIKGKTPEEAMSMSGQELAADLGPLPPTKVHCTSLVEGALRSALSSPDQKSPATAPPAQAATPSQPSSLSDTFARPTQKSGGVKVVLLGQ
jgi:nitrogen fixation protein NifU and related proteins